MRGLISQPPTIAAVKTIVYFPSSSESCNFELMSKSKSRIPQTKYNRRIHIDDDVEIKDRNMVVAYFLHFKDSDKDNSERKRERMRT